MFLCLVCRFETEVDDLAVPMAHGRGVCLPCYARATGTQRAMPRGLRREVSLTLSACGAA
jgi:hypothetical protein